MHTRTNPLDRVKVAAPCPADWERMTGGERTRFCHSCSLNVYNLSGMTKREAEALIMNAEGRLCVRYYRRADGTILTRDCPVGLRALKQRASRVARAALSAALTFLAGLGLYANLRPVTEEALMGAVALEPLEVEPVSTRPADAFDPEPFNGPIGAEEPDGEPVLGRIYVGGVTQVEMPYDEQPTKQRAKRKRRNR